VQATDVSGETFYASVFREAPGHEFAELTPSLRQNCLRLAGQTMGRLHREGRRFEPSRAFQRFRWPEDRWTRFPLLIPPREHEAWQLYRELEAWTRSLPRDPSLFGMIHGDFTILNMRILPERVTVFDFDSCCKHWYAYEIATFLHFFGGRDSATRSQVYNDVLDGYADEASIDERMLASIPWFGKMRLLYSFLVFAEVWGFEGLSSEQEEYFEVRRRLFIQDPVWPSRRSGPAAP
jgi:Ser/Thr protein kinase RdoA (MazF antagonist)